MASDEGQGSDLWPWVQGHDKRLVRDKISCYEHMFDYSYCIKSADEISLKHCQANFNGIQYFIVMSFGDEAAPYPCQ